MSLLMTLAILLIGMGAGALAVQGLVRQGRDRLIAERDAAMATAQERGDIILDQVHRLNEANDRIAALTRENQALRGRLEPIALPPPESTNRPEKQ